MTTTTLSLLSYNVRGLRDDIAAVVDVIDHANADVVLIQEAPKVFFPTTRAVRFAAQCHMYVAAGGRYGAAGNLILVRAPERVSAQHIVRYPLTPGQQARAAVMASYGLGDTNITIVGTHLSLHPVERVAQVDYLLDALPKDGATVVAGDINEKPGQPAWEKLAERFLDTGGLDNKPTFSSRNPRRRIDGIFVGSQLVLVDYRVITEKQVKRASDHLPIQAHLVLR